MKSSAKKKVPRGKSSGKKEVKMPNFLGFAANYPYTGWAKKNGPPSRNPKEATCHEMVSKDER